jgi:hypothetical protein
MERTDCGFSENEAAEDVGRNRRKYQPICTGLELKFGWCTDTQSS